MRQPVWWKKRRAAQSRTHANQRRLPHKFPLPLTWAAMGLRSAHGCDQALCDKPQQIERKLVLRSPETGSGLSVDLSCRQRSLEGNYNIHILRQQTCPVRNRSCLLPTLALPRSSGKPKITMQSKKRKNAITKKIRKVWDTTKSQIYDCATGRCYFSAQLYFARLRGVRVNR